MKSIRIASLLFAAALLSAATAENASANHSWGGYHWARTANPFTVKVGDNVTSTWDSYLATSVADWAKTSGSCNNSGNPVRGTIVAGGAGNVKRCNAVSGTIQVCNSSYGNNGWLGIASIWANGTHITQGTVKLNDYYFAQSQYNTPAWRQFVSSQELGHCYGLAHQDENFNNADLLDACGRGSCMDYSNEVSNQSTPNQHDYDELVLIYNHIDSFNSYVGPAGSSTVAMPEIDTERPSEWGRPVAYDSYGRATRFERDLGNGNVLLTSVIWAR